jgi:hypothetical protein
MSVILFDRHPELVAGSIVTQVQMDAETGSA